NFLYTYILEKKDKSPKCVLEYLKNCECTISIHKVILNLNSWGKLLINEKNINNSLVKKQIGPLIEEYGVENILNEFKAKVIIQLKCPQCGTQHELSSINLNSMEEDCIYCSVCKHELYSWNEAKSWTSRLI
ncbi:MAG TPA: hypothetical protein VFE71_04545, partial [Bacteroidales bacterium]|nr:hypothetical protein [Bacteroidales bacterium]